MKLLNKLRNIILGTYYNICNKHDDLANERLSICKNCEYKIPLSLNMNICDQCGCILESKARVKLEECPLNKW